MQIVKLARLLVLKYSLASLETEASVRADIKSLWKIPNDTFSILKACAESHPKNPKNPHEKKAVEGYKFCHQLVSTIDYLQANIQEISILEIKEIINELINLLKKNIYLKFSFSGEISEEGETNNIQFFHVSALIFEIIPVKTKYDRTIRDQQFNKARTGLSRILSISLSMLEKISKLEITSPEKFDNIKRFKPQRGLLSIYDIYSFIREYGPQYHIPDQETWGKIIDQDLQLKEQITTIINALNRGHHPIDKEEVKAEIKKVLERNLR